MHYLSAENLTKSYGIVPLFDNISFHVEEGDKIALVARNGSGKSTLLNILSGMETPDSGTTWIHKDVTVALFEQEPGFVEEDSILGNIFRHDHPVINAIAAYESACERNNTEELGEAIIRMDELGAWDFDAKVKQILGKLNVHNLHQPVSTLSGGQKKRVALARTLIDIGFDHRHVLLIMDEPTNHLDVDMVEWLEQFLNQERITLLLVTHDRYFLDNVCREIWELSDKKLFVYKGDYENYLEKKAARVESDAASLEKAKNLYRKELEWMRKQPRARTTKSKSRQDQFYEVEQRVRQRQDEAELQLQVKMSRLGGKVVEMKKVYKSFGNQVLLKGFDYTFKKGERIGIIGKNGSGKSTFASLVLGEEPADSGKINHGDTVVFGHYAQEGLVTTQDLRVIEYVKSIAEQFPLASGGSLSAAQFLQLFLFDPEKQYTPISKLSGGEKRRLHLLSILFRNPNFLVLDEPTNDLDLPTLTVLEQFLREFAGCLLIISHDRYFMDRLVDHLFVFEGNGIVKDFPGNYSQYRLAQQQKTGTPEPAPKVTTPRQEPTVQKKRPGYKEKREFELLDQEIRELNKEKEQLTIALNSGLQDYDQLQEMAVRLGELTELLDRKELRWLELSELSEGEF